MIVVAGCPRSGTTIMFRCLVESGFYPGEKLQGRGHKSEDAQLWKIVACFMQGYHFTRAREHKIARGRLIGKFKGPAVVKNPYLSNCIRHLHKNNQYFKDALYVWMRRDLKEIAKSLVRKKYKHPARHLDRYENFTTVSGALKLAMQLDDKWRKFLPRVRYIEIWLNDLIEKPDVVQQRMSEFIGRDFNISLVTKDETWAGSGEVYL
jgi:hypothetical protein